MEKEFVNMCLKLPADVHNIIFVQQAKMAADKKRKVNIKQAAIHIIKEWGKQNEQCANDTKK